MKRVFLALFFFSIAVGAFGQVISETKLSDLGIAQFETEGPNVENCKDIEFISPIGLSKEDYPVLSVHAAFLPVESKESFVTVFFNGKEANKIPATKFEENGFARFDLQQEEVREKNSLRVCFQNSFATTKTIFFTDSFIGFYKKEDFAKDGAFSLVVTPKNTRLFREFNVKATIKNFGSRDAQAKLLYRRADLENETPETELVKGKTEINQVVGKCIERDEEGNCIVPGEVSFEYSLRAKKLGALSMLPAIAEYENIFGEQVSIESDRPVIIVSEPEIELKGFIKSPKQEFFTDKPANLKLIIVNDGPTPLYNVTIKVEAPGLNIPAEQQSFFVEFIGEKQVIERDFEVSTQTPGVYEIGCSASYLTTEFEKSPCEKNSIEFHAPGLSMQVTAGILLVLVSFSIFVYIFYLKK